MRLLGAVATLLWLSRSYFAQDESPNSTMPVPEKLESNGNDTTLNASTNLDIEVATGSSNALSTETTTEITTQTPTLAPPNGNKNQLNYFPYCSCDLLAGQCDLNCCCDLDCNADDRALFASCWAPASNKNDRMYCSRDDYAIVWNNTPAYRTESGGLFCVVTDNVPRYSVYEEKPPLKSDDLFRLMIPGVTNRWTDNTHPFELEKWVYEPFYKEGSPLFTLDSKGALKTLRLPGSLNSAFCNVEKPVEFLRQQRVECHLRKQSCKTPMNPIEWLSDLAVFRLPPRTLHGAGNFTAAHGVQWNDADKLAPVILRVCDSGGCRADVRPPNPSCHVDLAVLTLRLGFNGTQGILYVLADLHYGNGSRIMKLETIFQSVTEWTGSPSRVRSGNPGYLKGKPLIFAKFNHTSGEGIYHTFTLFPAITKARQIMFGQDSLQTVQIMKPWKGNLTDWCPSWQNYILGALFGSDLDGIRVGPFGNSNLQDNKMNQWLPITIQSELACFSTKIRSDLMVVYTKTGTYDQPQNKLIGVALGLRSDREAKCNTIDGCTLSLTHSVSFVFSEITSETILPQPPRWRVHLPYDFFYPFLLSSSGVKITVTLMELGSVTLALFVHYCVL